jgi:hydroxymethylpyrimidine pyrophosphatase-like HAD family hydrolase
LRYHALACDYDGTLARNGVLAPETRAALTRLRGSGCHVLLVTGRRLDDLERVCPDLSIFDMVVAENGALAVRPGQGQPRLLGPEPPPALLERLRARGVTPLERGGVIVATTQPHEVEVVEAIRELGLELQVIFNKGAVMVLPSGVNKASGLELALADLGLSRHEVVGVGDGENDHAFLAHCQLSVAVADAVPSLAEAADVVTRGGAGDGVVELIGAMLSDDPALLTPRRARHRIALGRRGDGTPLTIGAGEGAILCVGDSESARAALLANVTARLADDAYQSCVIDATGAQHGRESGKEPGVVLGAPDRAPTLNEVLAAMAAPGRHVVVSVQAIARLDRPAFVESLLGRLIDLRRRVGRPHFMALAAGEDLLSEASIAQGVPTGALIVTSARPGRLPRRLLQAVSLVLAGGPQAAGALRAASDALGRRLVGPADVAIAAGEALGWSPGADAPPFPLRPTATTARV